MAILDWLTDRRLLLVLQVIIPVAAWLIVRAQIREMDRRRRAEDQKSLERLKRVEQMAREAQRLYEERLRRDENDQGPSDDQRR